MLCRQCSATKSSENQEQNSLTKSTSKNLVSSLVFSKGAKSRDQVARCLVGLHPSKSPALWRLATGLSRRGGRVGALGGTNWDVFDLVYVFMVV